MLLEVKLVQCSNNRPVIFILALTIATDYDMIKSAGALRFRRLFRRSHNMSVNSRLRGELIFLMGCTEWPIGIQIAGQLLLVSSFSIKLDRQSTPSLEEFKLPQFALYFPIGRECLSRNQFLSFLSSTTTETFDWISLFGDDRTATHNKLGSGYLLNIELNFLGGAAEIIICWKTLGRRSIESINRKTLSLYAHATGCL